MPTIATHSAERYQPAFYWHLGDLRATYKIDEDMAAAAASKGQPLSCEAYLKAAWPDFIEHQIAPFGATRFYLGIGNHEVIPPRTSTEFASQFQDWLLTPRLAMAGRDELDIAGAKSGPCQRIAARPYRSATPYYHWVRSNVDFIYLDNSTGIFPKDQLDQLEKMVYGAVIKKPNPLAYTAGTLLEATRQISQGLPWFFNRQGQK
jgi:hypothetical protein